MFAFEEFSLGFLSDSIVPVTLTLVVLFSVAIWNYYRTNPQISVGMRILLASLRSIAIVMLVLALYEPVVSYSRLLERSPRGAVLIDGSSSMDQLEAGLSRRARVDSLLSSEAFQLLRDSTDLSFYYFGGDFSDRQDKVDKERTAIGTALSEVMTQNGEEPIDFLLLMSDGNSNSGPEPRSIASGYGIPLQTIDMTTTGTLFDIGITEVEVNPVLFSGQPTDISVKLVWRGAGDRTVTVQLREDGNIIDRQEIQVTQEDGIGDISLKYIPQAPGQKLLNIEVPVSTDEPQGGNNAKSVAVKVLKSRLNVLIIAEHPDYEVGFLKRELASSDRFEISFISIGPKGSNQSGTFPTRQAELNRYDLVILYDPDPVTLVSRKEIIYSYLNERGGSILAMLGPNYATSRNRSWLDELLPFAPSGGMSLRYFDFHGVPSEEQLFHPALRIGETQSEIREAWSGRPPFQLLVGCDSIHPEATILASVPPSANLNRSMPLLGYRRFGSGKLLASTAQPWWKWKFAGLGYDEDGREYSDFIAGAVSWLSVKDDFEPVRILAQKDVLSRGEIVRFDAFAYDAGYRPLESVTGQIELISENGQDRIDRDFVVFEKGRMSALFENLSAGSYRWKGSLKKDESVLKQEEGRILIEPYSLEDANAWGDPALLTALAQKTGGKYYKFDNFDVAVKEISLSGIAEIESDEVVLWNHIWLLLIMIGSLSVEWLLRKTQHLV